MASENWTRENCTKFLRSNLHVQASARNIVSATNRLNNFGTNQNRSDTDLEQISFNSLKDGFFQYSSFITQTFQNTFLASVWHLFCRYNTCLDFSKILKIKKNSYFMILVQNIPLPNMKPAVQDSNAPGFPRQ